MIDYVKNSFPPRTLFEKPLPDSPADTANIPAQPNPNLNRFVITYSIVVRPGKNSQSKNDSHEVFSTNIHN